MAKPYYAYMIPTVNIYKLLGNWTVNEGFLILTFRNRALLVLQAFMMDYLTGEIDPFTGLPHSQRPMAG